MQYSVFLCSNKEPVQWYYCQIDNNYRYQIISVNILENNFTPHLFHFTYTLPATLFEQFVTWFLQSAPRTAFRSRPKESFFRLIIFRLTTTLGVITGWIEIWFPDIIPPHKHTRTEMGPSKRNVRQTSFRQLLLKGIQRGRIFLEITHHLLELETWF